MSAALYQVMPPLSADEYEALKADIAARGVQVPVEYDDRDNILDGHHRIQICEELGITHWPKVVRQGLTEQQKRHHARRLNLERRHLDRETRRILIADELRERPEASDRAIADSLKVDHKTVGSVRDGLVSGGEIPHLEERLGADGKSYPATQPEQPPAAPPINGQRAIAPTRIEPDDSLDFFPTPPWATRALIERVLPVLGVRSLGQVWEPACGEGHMSGVLEEYTQVVATDLADYSVDGRMPPAWWRTLDFLDETETTPAVDWIITNPPFADKSAQFVLRALPLASAGVAMFMRLQWLETINRYERIFCKTPPTLIAFFVERVNLCKGKWDPDGGTATAYIWLVWMKGRQPRAPFWIPPTCRDDLTRPDDVERFTARPVISKPRPVDAAGNVLHHDDDGVVVEFPAPEEQALEIPKFLRRGHPECTYGREP